MRILKIIGVIVALLGIAYFMGPKPETPQIDGALPTVPTNLTALEKYVKDYENSFKTIRLNNEARIVWADSNKQKTPFSVVYVHGFSASQTEGDPVHLNFAKRYNCNLFLARLEQHGLDTPEVFHDLTAEKMLASAKRAIAIGKQLGNKVIVMATSAGAMKVLYVASQNADIHALILYSPLVEIADPKAKFLDDPWGLQITRLAFGRNTTQHPEIDKDEAKYWTKDYRFEGVIALQNLLSVVTTPDVYQAVKMPVFMGYYYENEEKQDKVVSVAAMLRMFEQLGTPPELKRKVVFPDSKNHVITSYIKSKNIEAVEKETYRFVEEILKIKPINN